MEIYEIALSILGPILIGLGFLITTGRSKKAKAKEVEQKKVVVAQAKATETPREIVTLKATAKTKVSLVVNFDSKNDRPLHGEKLKTQLEFQDLFSTYFKNASKSYPTLDVKVYSRSDFGRGAKAIAVREKSDYIFEIRCAAYDGESIGTTIFHSGPPTAIVQSLVSNLQMALMRSPSELRTVSVNKNGEKNYLSVNRYGPAILIVAGYVDTKSEEKLILSKIDILAESILDSVMEVKNGNQV